MTKKTGSMSARRKHAKIEILIERDGNRCWFCWRPFDGETVKRTLDHMIPVSADGTNSVENLVLSCEGCNQIKGNRLRDYRPGCFRNLYRHVVL